MGSPEEIRKKYASLRENYSEKGLPMRDLESVGLTLTDAEDPSDYKTALIQLSALTKKVKKHSDIEIKTLKLYGAIADDLRKKGATFDDPRYLTKGYIKDRLRELKPKPKVQEPRYQEPEQQESVPQEPLITPPPKTLEEKVEPTLPQPHNGNNHPTDSQASSSVL